MVYNVLCRHCLILILITLRCRWELIPMLRWRKKTEAQKREIFGSGVDADVKYGLNSKAHALSITLHHLGTLIST